MSQEIEALEIWFKTAPRPELPIQLYPGVKIHNLDYFLECEFPKIKANPTAAVTQPILSRLRDVKALLIAQYGAE